LWHGSFVELFSHGTVDITSEHAFTIVVFGLVAAHICEKTGKLLLCITFHSAGNAFVMSAPVVGYLLHLYQ